MVKGSVPGKQNENESASSSSGLDMRATIAWYSANQDKLLSMLPQNEEADPPFPIEGQEHMHISAGRIAALVSLFPGVALERSRLQTGAFIGKPTLYFAKGTTPENLQTTQNADDALSATAIIPSYTDNSRWKETGEPSSDIWLFELPAFVSPKVKEIIHTQGAIHEFGHTLVTHALYGNGQRLMLTTGEEVESFDYIVTRFAKAAEKYPPISHYSSFYRKEGEEFGGLLAIEEELVESIAAELLGFAFSSREEARMQPFADRPDVFKIVDEFVHAMLIKEPKVTPTAQD